MSNKVKIKEGETFIKSYDAVYSLDVCNGVSLDLSARCIYLHLLSFAESTGNVHPSHAAIAEKFKISIKTSQRAIAKLELAGLIKASKKANCVNQYIVVPWYDAKPPAQTKVVDVPPAVTVPPALTTPPAQTEEKEYVSPEPKKEIDSKHPRNDSKPLSNVVDSQPAPRKEKPSKGFLGASDSISFEDIVGLGVSHNSAFNESGYNKIPRNTQYTEDDDCFLSSCK